MGAVRGLCANRVPPTTPILLVKMRSRREPKPSEEAFAEGGAWWWPLRRWSDPAGDDKNSIDALGKGRLGQNESLILLQV